MRCACFGLAFFVFAVCDASASVQYYYPMGFDEDELSNGTAVDGFYATLYAGQGPQNIQFSGAIAYDGTGLAVALTEPRLIMVDGSGKGRIVIKLSDTPVNAVFSFCYSYANSDTFGTFELRAGGENGSVEWSYGNLEQTDFNGSPVGDPAWLNTEQRGEPPVAGAWAFVTSPTQGLLFDTVVFTVINGDYVFDNFGVTITVDDNSNVPEPTTLAIWSMLSLVGAGAWRRRSRRA